MAHRLKAATPFALVCAIFIAFFAFGHQFESARMTDSTQANTIDDNVVDLENMLMYVFGIDGTEDDTDLTGSFIDMDIDGRVTNLMRFKSTAGLAGVRVRDSGADTEFKMAISGNYLAIYQNTGSEGTPAWGLRNRMNLADGTWDVGGGGADYFTDLLDTPSSYTAYAPFFTNSGGTGISSGQLSAGCVAYRSSTLAIPNLSWVEVSFPSESYDFTGNPVHSTVTNTEEFVAPTTGIYLFTAYVQISGNPDLGSSARIMVNGSTAYRQSWSASSYMTMSGLLYMTASDIATVEALQQNSGSDTYYITYAKAGFSRMVLN
jgi:hypothetical protein